MRDATFLVGKAEPALGAQAGLAIFPGGTAWERGWVRVAPAAGRALAPGASRGGGGRAPSAGPCAPLPNPGGVAEDD